VVFRAVVFKLMVWCGAGGYVSGLQDESYQLNESGLSQSALNRHTARPFIESDDTRGCNNTICPPEDEKGTVRNMLRIIM
jgi:hypothetical protein